MRKKLNKNKRKPNKNFYVFLGIICLAISFGVYKTVSNKKELNQNFEYTTGTITKKYYLSQRGDYIHYNYVVNSTLYKRSCKLTFDKELVNIGDQFEVKYSPKNPNNSELSFNKRITDKN